MANIFLKKMKKNASRMLLFHLYVIRLSAIDTQQGSAYVIDSCVVA